jgi:hypothetical protein
VVNITPLKKLTATKTPVEPGNEISKYLQIKAQIITKKEIKVTNKPITNEIYKGIAE